MAHDLLQPLGKSSVTTVMLILLTDRLRSAILAVVESLGRLLGISCSFSVVNWRAPSFYLLSTFGLGPVASSLPVVARDQSESILEKRKLQIDGASASYTKFKL